ncbi:MULTISPECIES: bifunctional riboflavin kinase/FAD synthetase [unclassified Frondihabitans]|uniref:bifunctional riboflavin kinase/FAD synthetase n=1 Tax=unclassified Frondihabitans TaxID=2626248 RepID=UPI000F4D8A42|nr:MULTISPECIES: bifunctional riboflavin kinase/FAD synthetase [unclassified Frondihabitans]RPE74576.1 riboflavin kinase/FMN adenylyltransferase [Frondihabitans sp. PhB153]RPF03005.1 riboflavin kinase/FMN adenylyltransferase [Frondihabitans sp. PhB161]
MEFFAGVDQVPPGFGPSAVTIGKFDGVHLGHRAVINALEDVARARDLVSAVVTFDRHPLAVLHPGSVPAALTSNRQKRELLDGTGVEATLLLTFDEQLRLLSPEQFVDRILVGALQAEVVLVGSDFRFGVRGTGTVDVLRELGRSRGFDVELIPDVLIPAFTVPGDPDGPERRVSSTWIRELLDEGKIDQATVLLGRAPSVRGVVVHGEKRGRELGYPTANIEPRSEGFVPADGVYAARVIIDGTVRAAAVSVGNNPTFDGVPEKQVEAYVLDFDSDLYGAEITVEFVRYLRGNVRFDGMPALIAQMADDVETVRGLLL